MLAAVLVAGVLAVPPAGFTDLLEPGLPAWRMDDAQREHWRLDDGILSYDGKSQSLVSKDDWGDFELYIDWKIEAGGDSGIYLRGFPQVQIWSDPIGSGGLWNNKVGPSKPLSAADAPLGEWNRFHIIMEGDRVTVWLNDTMVTDHVPLEPLGTEALPTRGPIELQNHGTPLWFRNAFIRSLDAPEVSAKQADLDRRMGWFRDARFGMFIHWGLYAIPAGVWQGKQVPSAGEWIMHTAKIKPADYAPLQAQFNPVRFVADEWVRIAKAAGQRYIVITSKHHDGFGLWDSAQTEWDVMGTPFRRDILKELADACARGGITLCFYHSIMDWTHPDYLPRRKWDDRPAETADLDRYVASMKAQLAELLSGKYGKIGILWFDGEWEDSWNHERGMDLAAFVRGLDPDIILNNRVDKGRKGMSGLDEGGEWAGDYGTPEQEVPATGMPGADWESCITMNKTWGFKQHDTEWKSAPDLIRMLADIASKGGNFLLNVGPQADGLIPQASIDRLMAIGAWMETNGESIYGTTASPFAALSFGRATVKALPEGDSRIYLHVFEWPSAPDGSAHLEIPGLMNEVIAARLLGETDATVGFTRTPGGWSLDLPAGAPDTVDSVIAIDVAGVPAVRASQGGAAASATHAGQ